MSTLEIIKQLRELHREVAANKGVSFREFIEICKDNKLNSFDAIKQGEQYFI